MQYEFNKFGVCTNPTVDMEPNAPKKSFPSLLIRWAVIDGLYYYAVDWMTSTGGVGWAVAANKTEGYKKLEEMRSAVVEYLQNIPACYREQKDEPYLRDWIRIYRNKCRLGIPEVKEMTQGSLF